MHFGEQVNVGEVGHTIFLAIVAPEMRRYSTCFNGLDPVSKRDALISLLDRAFLFLIRVTIAKNIIYAVDRRVDDFAGMRLQLRYEARVEFHTRL